MLTLRRFDQQIRAFVLLRARADPSCDGSKSLNWTDEHSKCVAPLHRCDDLVEVLIVESGCPFVNALHRGDKRTWVPVQTG